MSKIKIYLIIFIISFTGTIFYQSYRVAHSVLYAKWQEKEPAYDTFGEHISSLLLAFTRVKLYEAGISYDNWPQVYLKNWHKNVYESALSKIPESDGERIIWRRQYNFTPFYQADEKRYAPYIMHEAILAFYDLKEKPIASPWMDKVARYVKASILLSYFFHDAKYSGMPKNLHNFHRKKILNTSMEYLKNMDLELPIQQRISSLKIAPLTFFHVTYELLISDIKSSGKNISCDDKKIQDLKFVTDNLKFLHQKYAPMKLDEARLKDLHDSTNRLQVSLPTINKILQSKCNVTI